MKQKILVIHGGWAQESDDDYLQYLKEKKIHLNQDPAWALKNWRAQLVWHLGDQYEVTVPVMPSKDNAQYDQWKLWFERYFEFFSDDTILIGESLGATFLLKYISENDVPFSVKSLVLVAGGIDDAAGYSFGTFVVNKEKTKSIKDKVGEMAVFYSDNDPYTPLSQADRVAALHPRCHKEVLHDRGHFSVAVIPELIMYIKTLCQS